MMTSSTSPSGPICIPQITFARSMEGAGSEIGRIRGTLTLYLVEMVIRRPLTAVAKQAGGVIEQEQVVPEGEAFEHSSA
jgi:hypothetical protein